MEENVKASEPITPDNGETEEGVQSGEAGGGKTDTQPGRLDESGDSTGTGDIPQGTDEKLDALKQALSALQELTENISFKIDHDKHREELIDKLHDENQSYKSDLYKKLLMPLVNEIIYLIDGYTQLRKVYAEKDISQIDTQKLLKQFGEVADDLENALYKNGIEPYEAEEGTVVDFARQKILKTVPTDDPKKDKTVCDRLKKGFILEEKIIRQEQVSCYKFEENLSTKKE
jgi:molecular chaperone GrpE (heat shock protein)